MGVGPSICGPCYEVQEDVAALFRPEYPGAVLEEAGSIHLDLWHVLLCQFEALHIPPQNVTLSLLCTYSDSERFSLTEETMGKRCDGFFIAL